MKNYNTMLAKKKAKVFERIKKLEEVCEILYQRKEKMDYISVAAESQIPYSTLMKAPYRNVIDKWKKNVELNTIHSSDASILKAEIKYLNNIIKKLIKENNELKTKLYTVYIEK